MWERCSACRDLPCIAPGGPEIPPPVPPIAEDPAPVPKTGAAPPIVQKAPPKAPSQESGSGVKNKPRLSRPSDPIQSDALEPVSWDTQTVNQRTTTVSVDDFWAACSVGAGFIDQRVTNTGRPVNAVATFKAMLGFRAKC